MLKEGFPKKKKSKKYKRYWLSDLPGGGGGQNLKFISGKKLEENCQSLWIFGDYYVYILELVIELYIAICTRQ